jgi:hypothetical protein
MTNLSRIEAEFRDLSKRAQLERLNEIAEAINLPDPPAWPEPEISEKEPLRAPLIDSEIEGMLRLKADKAYAEIDEEE